MRMIAILLSAVLRPYMGRLYETIRPYMGWLEAHQPALWPAKYFSELSRLFFKSSQPAWLQLVILIAPVVVVLFLIQMGISNLLYGLLWLIGSVLALLYAQGVHTNTHHLDQFFAAVEQNDTAAMAKAMTWFAEVEAPLMAGLSPTGQLSRHILIRANEKLFSTLFWFLLLGPAGLLSYVCLIRLRRWTTASGENHRALLIMLNQLLEVLEWIPARLGVLSYAIVGGFTGAIDCAMQCRLGGWGEKENERLMLSAGLGAIGETDGVDSLRSESLEQLRDARDLVSRAHFLWLSVIAVTTLVGLLS